MFVRRRGGGLNHNYVLDLLVEIEDLNTDDGGGLVILAGPVDAEKPFGWWFNVYDAAAAAAAPRDENDEFCDGGELDDWAIWISDYRLEVRPRDIVARLIICDNCAPADAVKIARKLLLQAVEAASEKVAPARIDALRTGVARLLEQLDKKEKEREEKEAKWFDLTTLIDLYDGNGFLLLTAGSESTSPKWVKWKDKDAEKYASVELRIHRTSTPAYESKNAPTMTVLDVMRLVVPDYRDIEAFASDWFDDGELRVRILF